MNMATISVCSDFKTHLNINTVIFHYYLICYYIAKEHLFYIIIHNLNVIQKQDKK